MASVYRVGIIGCGGISRAHARGYKAVPRTEIVAAADIKEEAVKKFGEEFGVSKQYTDYQQMLEKEALDIISVCTWPQYRRDIVRNSAKFSLKAIYCEKPMCMNLREADEMVEVCQAAKIALIVGHQRRFEAQYVKAKEIIDSGAIGKLYKLEACCPEWDIFQWGTHWVDICRFYNNDEEAEWVLAQVDRRFDRIEFGHRLETECITYIKFKNNVKAFIETGYHFSGGFYNRIYGTEGTIEVNVPERPSIRARVLGEKDWIAPQLKREDPFKLVIEALIESIETGKTHILDGKSARKGQEIIMATYESAQTGKLVELPLQTCESPLEAMFQRMGVPLVVK